MNRFFVDIFGVMTNHVNRFFVDSFGVMTNKSKGEHKLSDI